MRSLNYLFIVALFCYCCERYPIDQRGTLQEVTGRILIAGVTENPPYVVLQNGVPTGIEVGMIRAFADNLNAEIEWIAGTEENIFLLLEKGKIHIAAGGFKKDNVWKKRVHFIHPYDTVIYKWGCPPEIAVPESLKDETVYVLKGSVAAAYAPDRTRVIFKDSLDGTEPLVVAAENDLKLLGYSVSHKKLKEQYLSLAIRNGENAFLKEIEKSLRSYEKRF